MAFSLLELSPGSSPSSLTFTRSDRGGAEFGGGGAGLDAAGDAESGVVELDAELEGLELCAHAPTLLTSNRTKKQLRIELFYRLRRIAPKQVYSNRQTQTWAA